MNRIPLSDQPLILVYHERQAQRYAQAVANLGFGRVVHASDEQSAKGWLDQVEVLFAWKFPVHLYTQAPRLRWVQWMGAGVEDVAGVLPESVKLTRIVGQFGNVMAEYVFTWLLHEYQGVDRFLLAKANHEWRPHRLESLAGKTLGVAGLGSIGKELVRLGKAFGMKVVGLSRTGANQNLVEQHFYPLQWLEFARQVDVLVVILPHTVETEKIVNESVLSVMPASSILVNIGRGKTIDEQALIKRLQAHALRAAILDVFFEEPLAPNHPFWDMPNVYLTPHNSGPSLIQDVSQFFYDNYLRYVNSQPLLGEVSRDRGY